MALYGYTVITGIIIWCRVVMCTLGPAGIFVRGGGEAQNAPHMYKKGSQYVQIGPQYVQKGLLSVTLELHSPIILFVIIYGSMYLSALSDSLLLFFYNFKLLHPREK